MRWTAEEKKIRQAEREAKKYIVRPHLIPTEEEETIRLTLELEVEKAIWGNV